MRFKRLLGRDWVTEIAYVGSRGVHLPLNNFNLNQLDPSLQQLGNTVLGVNVCQSVFWCHHRPQFDIEPPPTVSRTQLLRPFPQYTSLAYSRPLANMGDARYDAVQLKLQKRFTRGLSMLAHYTWSKSMDIGGTGNGIAFTDPTPIQNIYNIRDEWSLSTGDVPHRIVLNGVYELPFGRRKKMFNKINAVGDTIVGGWQLSGSFTYQSGTPLAITATNRMAIGNAVMPRVSSPAKRPGYSNGTARDRMRAGQTWFNTAAVINPNDARGVTNPDGPTTVDSTKFVFGNTSRTLGSVRRDRYSNLDLGLFKTFRLTEKLKFEFRGDFFNAFNYVVSARPYPT